MNAQNTLYAGAAIVVGGAVIYLLWTLNKAATGAGDAAKSVWDAASRAYDSAKERAQEVEHAQEDPVNKTVWGDLWDWGAGKTPEQSYSERSGQPATDTSAVDGGTP